MRCSPARGEKHAKGTSLRHIISHPCAEPSTSWFPSRIRWRELPETASACRTEDLNHEVSCALSPDAACRQPDGVCQTARFRARKVKLDFLPPRQWSAYWPSR